MDPVLASLAAAAGVALIQAMTGDAWSAAKERFSRILRAHRGERELEMRRELDASEGRVRSQSDPSASVISDEQARWAALLTAFLMEHREATAELQEFVVGLQRQAEHPSPPGVAQHIRVGRDAYIAGRDQYISPHEDER